MTVNGTTTGQHQELMDMIQKTIDMAFSQENFLLASLLQDTKKYVKYSKPYRENALNNSTIVQENTAQRNITLGIEEDISTSSIEDNISTSSIEDDISTPSIEDNASSSIVQQETEFHLVHPKTYCQEAFQIRRKGSNPRSSIPRWIPKTKWRNILDNWSPDGMKYLGGVKEIDITNVEIEKVWMKRCLTEKELLNVNDLEILYLCKELNEDGTNHRGWYKTMIMDKKTQEISARTITNIFQDIVDEGGLYTKTGKLSRKNKKSSVKDWYICFSKIIADESFFKSIGEKL